MPNPSSPSTAPVDLPAHGPYLTVRLFLVVTVAILFAEIAAILLLHRANPHQDIYHEAFEVAILTVLISALVYRFLLLPLNQEIARRRAAEEQATTERDKLENVTEAIGAGLVLLDRDFNIQWANGVMQKLFGVAAGDPCYRSFRRSEGDCPDCRAREIFSGEAEKATSSHRLTTSGGVEIWFDMIFTPLREPGSSAVSVLELLIPADERRRMEEALRVSEERYRHLIENTPDQIWEIDSTGRFSFASRNSKDILGYEAAELIGTRPFQYVIPSERQQAVDLFISYARDAKPLALLEYVLRHRDGRDVTVQVSGVPFFDGRGQLAGYRGVTRDITQKKAAESALRESEESFRSLAEQAGDGIIIAREDGSLIFTNRKMAEIMGRSREELGRMRLCDLAQGDQGLLLERNCRSRIRGEVVPDPYEICVLRRDGHEIPVEITGSRIIWRGDAADQMMVRDVTERKAFEEFRLRHQRLLEQQVREQTRELHQLIAVKEREVAERIAAEDSLRSSEEQFRQLFLQNEAAILLFDAADDSIIDANPAALDLFGYSRDELLRLDGKLLTVPEAHQSLAEFLHATHGQDRFNLRQASGLTRDGRPLAVSLWGKVVRLRDREVVYCSLTDITERIRLDEEKKLIQTRLIQVNRMNSLGLLVSGIAHEINNPNTNILISAQLLERAWRDIVPLLERLSRDEGDFLVGGAPVSEMRESLPRLAVSIVESARRIEGIIRNLREYAVQGRTTMQSNADLNRVVSVAASILQHQVKRATANFRLSLADYLPPVQGNPQQLEQVVINLLMNALQSLSGPERAVDVATEWDRKGDAAVISVRDEGCGIPREHLPRVFDPFFSTRLEKGGSGLGLSISNFIVREHGGLMEIDSASGAGTTVTVRLPLRSREVAA